MTEGISSIWRVGDMLLKFQGEKRGCIFSLEERLFSPGELC